MVPKYYFTKPKYTHPYSIHFSLPISPPTILSTAPTLNEIGLYCVAISWPNSGLSDSEHPNNMAPLVFLITVFSHAYRKIWKKIYKLFSEVNICRPIMPNEAVAGWIKSVEFEATKLSNW